MTVISRKQYSRFLQKKFTRAFWRRKSEFCNRLSCASAEEGREAKMKMRKRSDTINSMESFLSELIGQKMAENHI